MALVTITRSLGCGEADIAQRVARTMQVKLYDDKDINVSLLHIEVPELDITDVWGFAHTSEERDRIIQTLDNISDLKEVRTEITIMPSDGD